MSDEAPVRRFGSRTGTDDQMQLWFTLERLPSDLARKLDRFPTDLLSLEVRVTPPTTTTSG